METMETKEEPMDVKKIETRSRVKKAAVVLTIGLMGGALALYKFFKSKTCAKK